MEARTDWAILDRLPDGILITDPNGGILFASRPAEVMFGYAPGALTGQPVEMLLADALGSRHRQHRAVYTASPRPRLMGEFSHLLGQRLDGTQFPVEVGLTPLDPGGRPHVLAIVRDISERVKVEAQLRLQGAALSAAAHAIVITDADGKFTWVNPAFEQLTGYSAAEAIGQTFDLLRSGRHSLTFYQNIWDTITAGRVWHGEITNRRRDGSHYVEEQTITPVRGPQGEISAFVSIKLDITERKRQEVARERELAELAVLHASALAGAGATDVDALIERAADVIAELFPDNFGVALVDEAAGVLRVHSYRGPHKSMKGAELPLDLGVVGRALTTGQVQRIDDVAQEADYIDLGLGMRSELCVPLHFGDRTIGVINAESMRPAAFSLADERVLVIFAGQLAAAIENIRLHAATVRDARRREIVYQASQAIGASLDPEHLYAAVHQAMTQLMPTEALILSLMDETGTQAEDVYTWDRGGRWPNAKYPIAGGLLGFLIATGKPLLENDFGEAAQKNTGAVAVGDPENTRSVLAVPLRVQGRTIGMLSAQSYQPNAYTPEDLALLELLAAQVVVALDNARLFREVQQLSRLDSLTGVYNRRHLFEVCQREFDRAKRYGRSLAVVMIDLDRFKIVNDTHGHAVGDQVLAAVAVRCQAHLRAIDLLGRYGGEEFTLLLPETDAALAQIAAERLRAEVSGSPIDTAQGPVTVTLSMGVAALDDACASLDQLFARADQALYAAKGAGRNRVALWGDPDHRDSQP
jgi:diguanylate cyclase (GGDEF)-like protein/PAS domain S-box-containing protein